MAYDFNWDLKTVAPKINGFVQGFLSQKTEDKPTQTLSLLFSNSNEAAEENPDLLAFAKRDEDGTYETVITPRGQSYPALNLKDDTLVIHGEKIPLYQGQYSFIKGPNGSNMYLPHGKAVVIKENGKKLESPRVVDIEPLPPTAKKIFSYNFDPNGEEIPHGKTLALYDDKKLNPDGTFTPYLINTSDAIASGLVTG